jgi:hypothetical protein
MHFEVNLGKSLVGALAKEALDNEPAKKVQRVLQIPALVCHNQWRCAECPFGASREPDNECGRGHEPFAVGVAFITRFFFVQFKKSNR